MPEEPDVLDLIFRVVDNAINDTYSYIVDWKVSDPFNKMMSLMNHRIVVLGLFIISHFVRAHQVFERDFSLSDPLIQHPHTSEQ